MTIKVTYNVTDIYVSESVSATYINVSYEAPSGGGGAVWGDIIGTLSDQLDLQAALDAKYDDPTGTTAQYIRGDGSLATFPTIPSGTVTSVGLSMPSAFSVANSPITSSGTLAVTGAGTADQYVRGDGQLANFPTNGGGGSSVNYYLNGSVSQGTFGGDTYYEMSKTPIIGGGTNFTRTNAQGNGYIASFITDAGDPSLLNIPGGNWNVEFYFQASSGGGTPSFYGELYKVSSSNVFTLIASGSTNPEGITNGTAIDQYFTSIPVPQTSLLATDRLAIRIFVTPSGRTITLHTEDNNLCEVLTTFSTGLNALNGLTSQVQYFATGTSGTDFAISSATDTHTFNLPSASALNRGLLTSADWTTFNSKQNALTNPVTGTGVSGQVSYWSGTNTQTGNNNLFWDAANSRLGIGTATPSEILHLSGNNNGSTSDSPIATIRLEDIDASVANNQPIGKIQFWTNDATVPLVGEAAYILAKSAGSSGGGFMTFGTSDSATLAAERMRLTSNGRLLLGSITDSGQRLQVTGDTLMKGSGNTSATTALTVQNSDGTNLFRVRNDGFSLLGSSANVGLLPNNDGSNTPLLSGNSLRFLSGVSNQAQSGFTFRSFFSDFNGTSGTQNNVNLIQGFSPTSGSAVFNQLYLNFTINQTGGASGITRGLYIQPNIVTAADWRSIEWSNNTGWGLYGVGTSLNYLNGFLLLGSTTSSGERLQVNGTMKVTGASTFSSSVTAADFRLSALNTAPATAASTGTLGEIRIDANYIYICTATNTWKRVAIATW